MGVNKIIGLALVVLGAGLIYWGYDISGSIGSQMTDAFSGSDNEVIYRYIGGGVSAAVGLFLFLKG